MINLSNSKLLHPYPFASFDNNSNFAYSFDHEKLKRLVDFITVMPNEDAG